jgi:signal transduction histidine kinase
LGKFIARLSLSLDRVVDRLGGGNITLLAVAMFLAMLIIIFNDYCLNLIKDQNANSSALKRSQLQIQQLESYLYEAESAQRGYLLTQREDYLKPFNNAVSGAKFNIDLLENSSESIYKDKNLQKLRLLLERISSTVDTKAAEMNVTVGLAKQGKIKEAIAVVKLDSGLNETKIITADIDSIVSIQSKLLEEISEARTKVLFLARFAVIITSLLLIVLVVVVVRKLLVDISESNLLKKKLIDINNFSEKEIKEQRKMLRNMALDYQTDAERERQKLAREIHDELGSILTAVKMDITWIIKKLGNDQLEIIDKLRKTNKYLDQGISFKRQVVQDLHPSMISSFGFWPALKTLVEEVAERNQWKLIFETPEDDPPINETISLVAYRIVQETLNNASKYAKASQLSVHIIKDEKYLKIEIEDNGVGADLQNLNHSSHGLSGMRHRVLALGGHFDVNSEPGKGMLTKALIPLNINKYDY